MRKISISFFMIFIFSVSSVVLSDGFPSFKSKVNTKEESEIIIDPLKFVHNNGSTSKCPKNIILFIGDGLGFNHLNVSNLYQYGKYKKEIYERFPVKMGLSTFPYDGSYDPQKAWDDFNYVSYGYTDSAAAATALATGFKTKNGIIGLDASGNILRNVLEVAEDSDKSTGVVTSVQMSHATPAGFVAHNQDRNNYEEIANEMIYQSEIDVIMGCGNPYFDSNGEYLVNPNSFKYIGGQQTWDDLLAGTAGSDSDRDGDIDYWKLIQLREEFQSLMVGDTPNRVIGIPQVYQTLQQKRNGDKLADPHQVSFIESVPSLEEMALAAINILDEDEDGFFLMVEGGAIDWASHNNQPGRLVEEILEFNKAIESVINWIRKYSNWGETLVIVTADHETGYITGSNSGMNEEGNSIWNEIESNGLLTLPNFVFNKDGHTNSLIPFFAKGFSANIFKNTLEHSYDPIRGKYFDNTKIGEMLSILSRFTEIYSWVKIYSTSLQGKKIESIRVIIQIFKS